MFGKPLHLSFLSPYRLQDKSSSELTNSNKNLRTSDLQSMYTLRKGKMNNKVTTLVLLAFFYSSAIAQNFQLERTFYAPGEQIRVHFTAPNGLAEDAWIGILPATIPHGNEARNDKHDLAFQYLKGRSTGTLTFIAPSEFGDYDFRMHDTDNSGQEIASISFAVGKLQLYTNAEVRLEKSFFEPGENITVYFSAPQEAKADAWLGIVPSSVPHGSEQINDKNDISYQYLKNRTTGSLTFKAPGRPGNYDFRLHDSDDNGKEIATVSFVVGIENGTMDNKAFLSLESEVYSPGQAMVLHFTAPAGFNENAWIGIVPSDIPHGNESRNDEHDLSYQYLQKRTTGSLTFRAPETPGQYDFRMHNNDDNGQEVFSLTFIVE